MTNSVKVTANEAGSPIVVSEMNPEYAHIRVIQERVVFDERGWARKKVLSALIPGTVEDLKSLGWSKDQEVAGKIIVKESLNPFNLKDPTRDYKVAGKTGIICSQNGKPVYRKTFFTTSAVAEDIIVPHTNGDDIKIAYAALENEVIKETASKLDS